MKLTATPDPEMSSIVIDGTDLPQSRVTVYRYNADGTVTVLRGSQDIGVTKGVVQAIDTEAPFSETLHYVVLVSVAQQDRLIQRNLVTNPSFETNTTSWTAGTGRTIQRVTLLSAGGETGDAQPFDVSGITPTHGPNLRLAITSDPITDAVRDPATNEWYVSQSKPGTVGSALSVVISRVSPAGVFLDSMVLVNGGLGEQIDLQRINNEIWVWMNYRTVDPVTGATTANDLARVRYSPGNKVKASLSSADYVPINKFTAAYTTAKLDLANDYVFLWTESGTSPTRQRTYYRRKYSEMLTSTDVTYGGIGPFDVDVENPSGNGRTLQGFAFYKDTLYRYTGSPADGDPFELNVYTVPSTALATPGDSLQYTVDVSENGLQADGTPTGNYYEPGGLSLYRQSSGELVLLQSVTTGASTARLNQTFLYVQPISEARGSVGESAWVGKNVLRASTRTTQPGDLPDDPPDAPLARVAVTPVTSTSPKEYELSLHARLNDDSLSYLFEGEILLGTDPVTWGNVFSTYPNWGLPLAEELTWGDLTYSYIDGVTDEWVRTDVPTDDEEFFSDNGTYVPQTGAIMVPPERAALEAYNYVTNPTFSGGTTTGYAASVTSGIAPQLMVFALDVDAGEYAMQATLSEIGINPRITFNVSGLVPGQVYSASLQAKLLVDQELHLSTHNGAEVSLGIVGDEFNDWMGDSVTFTAQSAIEAITILFADATPGYVIIDQVMVSGDSVDYFDGDTYGGTSTGHGQPYDETYFYSWTSGPNASTSRRTIHSTLYSPPVFGGIHTEIRLGWQLSPIDNKVVRYVMGVVDQDGNQLIEPTYASLYGGGPPIPGSSSYGGGNYGEGGYGTGAPGGATGATVDVWMNGVVDNRDWPEIWRAYITVEAPGVQAKAISEYHVYNRPLFTPYALQLFARVLNPSNAVIMTLPVEENTVSVINWSELRWTFTLPPTVTGQYKIEIVPQVTWEGARAAWQLDGVMLQAMPVQDGALAYLDGSIPLPDVGAPGWISFEDQGPNDVASADALIRWTGTAHASTSEFIGGSSVTLVRDARLDEPIGVYADLVPNCEPINLTDPTSPELNTWFTLQSVSDLNYEARSQAFTVLNRRAPIVFSQVRSTATGSMTLILTTLEERRHLLDLTTSGRVLLLRNPDTSYPENNWYLAVGAMAETRIVGDHRMAYRRFTLEFVVVDRPGGLIASVPAITWETVGAMYTSWGPILAPNSVLANADTWNELRLTQPMIDNPLEIAGRYA